MSKKKSTEFHEKCKFLVFKFCGTPDNWGKQIKMAQQLLSQYPNIEFWDSLKPQDYEGLQFFLSESGQIFLADAHKRFYLRLPEKKVYKLEDEIIQSFDTSRKPRTLKEFLSDS